MCIHSSSACFYIFLFVFLWIPSLTKASLFKIYLLCIFTCVGLKAYLFRGRYVTQTTLHNIYSIK